MQNNNYFRRADAALPLFEIETQQGFGMNLADWQQ
jgi:hypothetical protein